MYDGLVITCPFCERTGPHSVNVHNLYGVGGELEYRYSVPKCIECGKAFSIQVKEKGDDYERESRPADPYEEESSH